jgi:Putative Ig domain
LVIVAGIAFLTAPAGASAAPVRTPAAPLVSGNADNRVAAATAGTNIGNATPVTGTVSGTITDGSDDWWVVYPGTLGGPVKVTVANTGGGSACIIVASLDGTGGNDQRLVNAEIHPGGSGVLQDSALGSDRFYVEVGSFDCTPTTSAPYTLTLSSGGGGAPPNPVAGSITPGTTIGNAWPPLLGHTFYPETLASAQSEDWYVLYKKPGTALASIRVENTTLAGPGACTLDATLYNTNAADGTLDGRRVFDNGAEVFTIPGTETIDPQGRYFLKISSFDCSTGGATYRIEPEPATQWSNPASIPGSKITAGTTIGSAWPPLQGGTSYHHALASAQSQDWYVLYKKRDTTPATFRVENTTLAGPGACTLDATLYNTNGTAGTLNGRRVFDNGSETFTVPGTETIDRQGRYFLQIASFDCTSGGATYSIEPEPATQWSNPAKPASALLPAGPSKKAAGGPLVGNVTYQQSLATASSKGWTYFQANGSTPVTVRVEDVTPGGDSCERVGVTLQNSQGATLQVAQIGDNGASGMTIGKAGTYFLELTPALECSPTAPLHAIVYLTPASGLRGPALNVSNPALPKGTVGQAYSATIAVTGGTKPYTFTAETALPPGLSLNSKTGAISGMPTQAGKYTFLVKITDSTTATHQSVTDLFQLTIS